jgi:hypothetical protein
MAKADRAELLLAHVVPYPAPLLRDGYISPKVYDRVIRSTRAAGQKQLDRLITKARAKGVKARGMLLEGMPASRPRADGGHGAGRSRPAGDAGRTRLKRSRLTSS